MNSSTYTFLFFCTESNRMIESILTGVGRGAVLDLFEQRRLFGLCSMIYFIFFGGGDYLVVEDFFIYFSYNKKLPDELWP